MASLRGSQSSKVQPREPKSGTGCSWLQSSWTARVHSNIKTYKLRTQVRVRGCGSQRDFSHGIASLCAQLSFLELDFSAPPQAKHNGLESWLSVALGRKLQTNRGICLCLTHQLRWVEKLEHLLWNEECWIFLEAISFHVCKNLQVGVAIWP